MKTKITNTCYLLCFILMSCFAALASPWPASIDSDADVINSSNYPPAYGPFFPGISLEINDFGQISTSQVEVLINLTDVATLKFLEINTDEQYSNLRMGYEEERVYGNAYSLPEGTEYLELELKEGYDGVDWNKVKFMINDSFAVTIGDYPHEPINSLWFKVQIPLTDFNSSGIDKVQLVSFPHTNKVHIGVEEIKFTGGSEDFIWFGENKFDNAIKSNGHRLYLYDNPPVIEEVRLELLNHNREFTKTFMPFSSMKLTLPPGETKMVGIMTTDDGTQYYSDTLVYTVSAGIMPRVWHVSCSGAADGRINTTVDGGTEPYEYNWSHGATNKDVSGLAPGVYNLVVTDANGKMDSTTVKIKEPVEMSATLQQSQCEGEIEASGGTSPYYYAIDDGSFQNFETSEGGEIWEVVSNHDPDIDYLNMAVEVKSDGDNNILVAGNYNGELAFKGNQVGAAGQQGIYIVKFDAKGDFIWEVSSQSDVPDGAAELRDMAVSDEGGVFFAFYIPKGNVKASDGTYVLSEGDYLGKITPDGRIDWIISMPKGVSHIGVDGLNNVYVSGKISDNFFSLPEFNHIKGSTDLYLAQYTEDAMLHWVKKIEGNNSERIEDMEVADSGDVYLTGAFQTDISFDGLKFHSTGHNDVFIAKYNAIGAAMWARTGGGTANDAGTAVAFDGNENVYLSIIFGGDYNTFGDKLYRQPLVVLANLNAYDGSTKWIAPVILIDGSIKDNYVTGIAVDKFPFIYVTGVSKSRVNAGYSYEYYDGGFAMSFNGNGEFFRRIDLAYTPYPQAYSITSTNDDYIIYSNYDEFLSITKFGSANKVIVDLSEVESTITVMDAHSCRITIDVEEPVVAEPSICYVTTSDAGDGVKISWDTDGADAVDHYRVYKEDKVHNDFKFIGSGSSDGEFYDTLADVQTRSYRYSVSAVGNCGNETPQSTPHKTMHLTVNEGNKGQINLIWDRYEGFDYPSFKILRGPSPEEMAYLDQVPSSLYTYTDNDPGSASLFYQIIVEANASGVPAGCGFENDSETTGRVTTEQTMIGSNIATRFGAIGKLSFYPNPGSDIINVKFSPDGDYHQLQVIDAAGRVVRTIDNVFDKAVIKKDNLPTGIYNVILNKNSGKPIHGRIAFQ